MTDRPPGSPGSEEPPEPLGPREVVLCPATPLLLRGLSGATDVLADLRARCVSALVQSLDGRVETVVVVGGHDRPGRWPAGSRLDVSRFGTAPRATGPGVPVGPRGAAGRGQEGLPLALGVGVALLEEAGWAGAVELHAVGRTAADPELVALADRLRADPAGVVLLVGEGSARRGEKAPGFLDERAFVLDDQLARALATGDGAALADLDPVLAEELMVGGAAVLRLLGRLLPHPTRAALCDRQDPFGVSYFVARWSG